MNTFISVNYFCRSCNSGWRFTHKTGKLLRSCGLCKSEFILALSIEDIVIEKDDIKEYIKLEK